MRALLRMLPAIAIILCATATWPVAEDAPVDDPYILYRVAGRTWTLKRTPKAGNEGGDTFVSYLRTEITAVWDNRAEAIQTILDAGRGEPEGGGTKLSIRFDPEQPMFADPIGMRRVRVERVRVPAGTFECIVWRSDVDGVAEVWRSTEFPTLVVKSDDRFGTRELVEFDRVPGDPGYEEPNRRRGQRRPARRADRDSDEPVQHRLFTQRGRSWVLKTTTFRGRHRTRSVTHQRYEVTRVTDVGCVLEITPLNHNLERQRDAEVERVEVKFDNDFHMWLEPRERSRIDRTERRLTSHGLFECTVYAYRDADSRECFAWYANEWPGLMIRRTATGAEFEQLVELVEFNP
jgi:hypothetical protein